MSDHFLTVSSTVAGVLAYHYTADVVGGSVIDCDTITAQTPAGYESKPQAGYCCCLVFWSISGGSVSPCWVKRCINIFSMLTQCRTTGRQADATFTEASLSLFPRAQRQCWQQLRWKAERWLDETSPSLSCTDWICNWNQSDNKKLQTHTQ